MPEHDIAIIGGGPAGLVATKYALHAQLRTVLIAPELGGKVSYPFVLRETEPVDTVWGAEIVHRFEDDIIANTKIQYIRQDASKVVIHEPGGFLIKLADGTVVDAATVILCTGATPQRLYVAGEKEYWGSGVSFSAISHAPLFRGRDVAVVGGRERALVATLELARLAQRVYFIAAHPQMMAELPEAALVQQHHNVSVFSNWEVQEIVGDDFVTGITLVGANGETRSLPVDGVFIQFALLPNNELVRDLIELDHSGRVCVNNQCETNVPGFFAAGDVTNIEAEQVLAAIGEGAKAALSAWKYLATRP